MHAVNSAPSGPGSTMVAPSVRKCADRPIDDGDALLVRLGKKRPVQVFADDTDAQAVEPPRAAQSWHTASPACGRR